jgi:ABC-type dipeptide/oligopeptide/nickel transport system ATPase component
LSAFGEQVQDLRKVFQMGDSNFVAADGINIDIPAGTITALVGPSGSGVGLASTPQHHIHFMKCMEANVGLTILLQIKRSPLLHN